jgi:hypothetical protein
MRDQRFRAEQSSPETSWKKSKSLALATLLFRLSPARSETREQWIELGAKAHSAFGAFIQAGIRVGLDARERLTADARRSQRHPRPGDRPPLTNIPPFGFQMPKFHSFHNLLQF